MADWPTVASLATAGGTLVFAGATFAAVRNAGQGVAVLHGWYCFAGWRPGDNRPTPADDFHRLTRDLYVPAGDVGFCQGAIRDPNDPDRPDLLAAIAGHQQLTLDVLYGDHEGGQRSVARFALAPVEDGYLFSLSRQWNLDQPDPR